MSDDPILTALDPLDGFDPVAFKRDHPEATPEEARLAHRDALAEALHAQFLDLWDQMADRAQLAVLAGGSVAVGLNIKMPEATTGPQLVKN